MKFFITGTGTDVGKTVVSGWITVHTNYHYFKPIQSGSPTDSELIRGFDVLVHKESYSFQMPMSPHEAAKMEGVEIDMNSIHLPASKNLIVEGAGGILVPLNKKNLMIDLIKKFNIPVIIVSKPGLGTINHTLMTIRILRDNDVDILGVIMNGEDVLRESNAKSIKMFGDIEILAELPVFNKIDKHCLLKCKMPEKLKVLF